MDLGIQGYSTNLKVLENIDPRKYPSFHARVYWALMEGEYRLIDIHDSKDLSVIDSEGNRYYTFIDVVPYERRLVYIFEFDRKKFALLHPYAARSLDERMAVEGVSDPERYEKLLEELKRPNTLIEGYRSEPFKIYIPLVAFKNLDTLVDRYAEEIDLLDKDRELGVIKSYGLLINKTDHRNLPRLLPSPRYRPFPYLAVLDLLPIKRMLFVQVFAPSWSRIKATYEFLKEYIHPSMRDTYLYYPPREYVGEDYEPKPFFKPEGVPDPVNYVELARFYNTLMDQEVDGKPIGRIREEDPVLYANIIRTFAHMEAKLRVFRAFTFPYETIAERYL